MSDWIYVDSSNIEAIRHVGGDLHVRFKNGAEYVYSDVPEHVYEGLLHADSKGSYMHREIKGKFSYSKA